MFLFPICPFSSFPIQALEIQNLYKICTETVLQCLDCDSVQTRESYQLSLALHIQEDRNALVLFLFQRLLSDTTLSPS